MSCSLCEHCPVLPTCRGTVLLGSRVPDLMSKLVGRIHEVDGEFSVTDGFVQGRIASFAAFLENFQRVFAWNGLEKEGLSVLFLRENVAYTFRTALETRTLEQWERLREASDLGDIIEDRRVVTWFHPIWDTTTKELYGWECLLRGVRADGTLLPPGPMFDQAQKAGLTFPLDRLARLNALQTAQDRGVGRNLFINFLPTAIYDPVFCLRTTVDLATSLGIANHRIVFEVVETEKVDDLDHLKSIVEFYRAQGFRIALDDVGSGYSSLNQLVRLNPDILKVDLEIIRHIDTDPVKQAVFRALASVAHDTGARLLAEGVETRAELEFVVGEGATLAQGFLWGPPRAVPDETLAYE